MRWLFGPFMCVPHCWLQCSQCVNFTHIHFSVICVFVCMLSCLLKPIKSFNIFNSFILFISICFFLFAIFARNFSLFETIYGIKMLISFQMFILLSIFTPIVSAEFWCLWSCYLCLFTLQPSNYIIPLHTNKNGNSILSDYSVKFIFSLLSKEKYHK